ncbi:exodeoxyribonuclease V subunit beta [Halomonas huangheensis]|uniref:RecBCD enzyme subunit RecB n=1 Tax=Halomonas huangheensis TaxID=1178482 RepID=W1N389_9GAMM|nr:exodeoxyribonuclease V subunit beta [Halomonas huangheensis]ALM51558.1 exodeoxyribonuclease V subunit beta [Halomonas huangheensis]ERL50032.1 hypothetical protein BJB45_02575 [Halomonas huangheensis]
MTDASATLPVIALDPLSLELDGHRLIEASAGTGKTFTLALLYVRLVLGPRDANDKAAFPRPLTPPEILVVTFTNAATMELRDRIRARLVEAAELFLLAEPGDENNPLVRLRTQWPEDQWPACGRRLQLAAEWMDEAAISTIHAWCHRMLGEHAFDSGSLFSLALETDQSELEMEVARDYWRTFLYPLDIESLEQITQHWRTPEELHQALSRFLAHAEALGDAPPPQETLAEVERERCRALSDIKAGWPQWVEELSEALEEAAGRKAFAGQKLNARNRTNWLDALRSWANDPQLEHPTLSDAAWARLSPSGMAEIWKSGEPLDHPALHALEALPAQLQALPRAWPGLVRHAVHWMAQRRHQAQLKRAEIGPDDLLTHLDHALNGDSEDRLATRIRRQFPVAMVDEFQDTDPTQYRIFQQVYRLGEAESADDIGDDERCSLLLIGDPKQAIYAFRGADIHTYLQARRDTAGRHATLTTNFRSSRGMVTAVNRCFLQAESYPRGAFLFRGVNSDSVDGKSADDNPIPFIEVGARGRDEVLTQRGSDQQHHALPALTIWHHDSETVLSKGQYRERMAVACASHMVELLQAAERGDAGFSGLQQLDDHFRPLRPGDLAVLVNNAGEARAIRQALARRGVRSVYLSDKDGVFASPAALEIERWLRAVSHPDDGSALRSALASPSLGLSLADLDRLAGGPDQDELAWESRVLQFRDYRQRWRRQGVLPMLHRLMNDFDVPARLLADDNDGERQLTDLLHLGELLQKVSLELDGEHALIRHIAEARHNEASGDDSHRLRLESDADLVQVVTIHKSKGLEYPLVFLPFIASHRRTQASDVPLWWHDGTRRQLALSVDDEIIAHAETERLAEDLRKLYVAMTRARHATWMGLAPLKELEHSAIGYLLAGGAELAPDQLTRALERLASEESGIDVQPLPVVTDIRIDTRPAAAELHAARVPLRSAREHWWIASYSALQLGTLRQPSLASQQQLLLDAESTETAPLVVADDADMRLVQPGNEPTTPQEANTRELASEPVDIATQPEPRSPGTLHRFPRGPAAGTFLHGLLEWAGEHGFAMTASSSELDDMLARRTRLRGWDAWQPSLRQWLDELLTTELPLPDANQMCLGQLEAHHYQVELEFWLASHSVDVRRLDDLVCQHLLPGHARPRLEPDTLNGMLKGFIDLVVEHSGRFYVLDWKSNHLGDHDQDYSVKRMREAVLAKRYDVQYALYLLAVHRLLKSRMADYSPSQHLGGAVYVFLRGTTSDSRGVHAECPSENFINALDALFRGATRPDGALS